MGVISAKCTKCGAELNLDDSREIAFCQYCGHKLIISPVQKTQHTTVIRDEAEIIRANTEAKGQEIAEENRKRAARTKRNKTLIKLCIPVILILFIFIRSYNPGTNYKLVKSTGYPEQAFNVTPEQLVNKFLSIDTHSAEDYSLTHTKWIPYEGDEEFFTSTYNRLYNGERRYECYFYVPNDTNVEEPSALDDDRVYYRLYIQTDEEEHILYSALSIKFRDDTLASEDTLNGYFGTTLPGEIFSIITNQKGDFCVSKLIKAKNAFLSNYVTDKNVRFFYKKFTSSIRYTVALTYDN